MTKRGKNVFIVATLFHLEPNPLVEAIPTPLDETKVADRPNAACCFLQKSSSTAESQ